ncbi:hypothetical protein [Pontibacter sp. G13]|uniref:hypothetical protein n=1 Tax=Pontibacter sp. G13 TaxID=3074898 RepID=UPI00288900EA|nr:hypothetical protein [Pontibacter sp. G13]WNJ17554.1 hypothetical protein RJD25_22115 [Pontibacter sp. G13]
MPEDQNLQLDPGQVQRLETRIVNVITNAGRPYNISAAKTEAKSSGNTEQNQTSFGSDLEQYSMRLETMAKGIVCIPLFEIYDERKVETPLKTVNTVDVYLSLSVQYIYGDIIFHTTELQLQGTGRNRDQAINDVIRNIKPSDRRWGGFLRATQDNIVEYYDHACEHIIGQAQELEDLGDNFKALCLLWPIPREVECYEEVRETTIRLYDKYLDKYCERLILVAKTFKAENNYEAAAAVLRLINPVSACKEDAEALIDELGEQVDEDRDVDREIEREKALRDDEMLKYMFKVMEPDIQERQAKELIIKITNE